MFPWPSHYLPIVPLGWACQLAGHEVRVASMAEMTGAILESGLPGVRVGPPGGAAETFQRAGLAAPRTPPPPPKPGQRADLGPWPADWPVHADRLTADQRAAVAKIGQFGSVIAESQVDDLVRLVRRWRPDVILHDGTQFAAPVVSAITGVPTVRYLVGNPGMLRVDTAYGTEPVPEYVRLFETFGVEPRTEPDAWLDVCPPSVQYPYPGDARVLRMRYVPYNGPGAVPDWLHRPASRPRVAVTWGVTEAELRGTQMVDACRLLLDAVTGLDVEPVVAISPTLRDLLGELPAGVRVGVSLPLHALLPTCAAVIHHAGPGTTMTSSACGVPQLMITKPPHYALPGARVAATGAGRHLLMEDLPAGEEGVAMIRREVAELLADPSYRENAERLRDEIAAQPSPTDVVAELAHLR
jgi:UDP:flavonoid glycosyltransferase YjiC (YdhE family)